MDVGAGECGGYVEELTAVLMAAVAALRELPASVHRLSGDELSGLLTVVDQVGALAGAGRFTITAEAVQRGEVASSQSASTQQWVASRCPSLDARDAGVVAKAVRELVGAELARARTEVRAGRLSVPAACVVATEWRQLSPLVEPGAEEAVLAGLVAIGRSEGAAGIRALRPALLARYGLGEMVQDIEDRHRGLTVLSCGRDIGGGITEYRMRLAVEARAVVEAAINAASAPRPVDGEQDPRTVEQRRGDALVDVCRRAVAHGADPTPPSGVKATVMVTIGLEEMRRRVRPGALVGGVDAGALLGPETVRKLACDARVLPVVLGSEGEVLDLGRSQRLFSRAQVSALWLRDRHCTFPGCRAPAGWCDAHHIEHWVDGGPTGIGNGALLCARHHTIVHRDRLTATVTVSGGTTNGSSSLTTGARVTWDQTPGSYDSALARGPTRRPAA